MSSAEGDRNGSDDGIAGTMSCQGRRHSETPVRAAAAFFAASAARFCSAAAARAWAWAAASKSSLVAHGGFEVDGDDEED